MLNLPFTWGAAGRALGRVPGWAKTLVKVWLVWFWRLSVPAKIAATAAEIVVLYLALPHIPLVSQRRTAILEFGSVGLCFLAIAGILFGGPKRA
ncbi:MAG: hypothetical protein ABSB24_17055 [Gaiellaceae bacterium]